MAVGAMALAKMKAIVSKLVAIEEMAGMDILCSDKTGTITQNKIKISEVIPLGRHRREDVLLAAWLASKDDNRDPIDQAVWSAFQNQDSSEGGAEKYKKIKFIPFDPISKRTEATIRIKSGSQFKVAKGAAQQIISMCRPGRALSSQVKKMVDKFASKGYRSLAVARASGVKNWKLIGLLALNDPPREDSAATIKNAQEMGVDVKMITGDHVAIAREICRDIHLGSNII
jgi:H+-transporting ATPase